MTLDQVVEQCVRRHYASCHGELELRLGTLCDSRFVPGVPRGVFEDLEQDLLECPTLVADDRWYEVIDFHYVLPSSQKARTRVAYDAESIRTTQEHVLKRSVEHVVLRIDDGEATAVKLARAIEDPLESPPQACIPTCVRIKQRRCFRDVRDGACVWSYELSRTWSSNDRLAVEHLQRTSEPTYEVECELVDDGAAYREADGTAHIAESLLLKARLLLGADDASRIALAIDATSRSSPRGRKRPASGGAQKG
jgi:hypothetical protein